MPVRNIIVTGATSMIGAALVKAALADTDIGHIYAVVRPGTLKRMRLPENEAVSIVECEMDGYSGLSRKIEIPVDLFFHLAWTRTPTYGESIDDVCEKSKSLFHAMEALRTASRLGCKTFIGAGSQSEYGIIPSGAIGPDTPCNPVRADGMLRLTAGRLVNMASQKLEMNSAWIRVFSIYGTNDRDNSMIKSTIRKLRMGERCSFTQCEQVWDYLYESDAGAAFLAAGKSVKGNKTYCLGSGEARSLKNYLYAIRDVVAPEAELGIGELPYPNDPVMNLQCDISSLMQDTGWKPEVKFEEGIRRMLSDEE